ncbi:MAG TPA: hypothetical protein VGR35_13685 [Tepidisphaeraceae bacterium]|nr:hypothetical protein [Tepidisphaeraceae bacterium]
MVRISRAPGGFDVMGTPWPLIAAARELRDRYLERVNEQPDALIAPAGRYDVSRGLHSAARLLPAA